MTVAQQLIRARTSLVLDQPFFGMLALRLEFVEDLNTKTLAVDGQHIFYNPEFFERLSPALTKSALCHEVLHCVFEHINRCGRRNPVKYNMAGDYVVNAVLKDMGFEVGRDWLYNPAYAGMSSDEIYALLPDTPGQEPLDELREGASDDKEVQASDWRIATHQAATCAKAMGKLPAKLTRFIDTLCKPAVDWRERLQRFVNETCKDDYSWLRPNRYFINQRLMLPTLHSEGMGEIVIVIDTSGSIGQAMLNAFGAEIKAIVHNVRPSTTHIIYCDAAVNHVDRFCPNEELHFDKHGGGGTDFRPPFDYIDKHGLQPACLVYLTDGNGTFPETLELPVLWCCTTNVVAPCGETVHIALGC